MFHFFKKDNLAVESKTPKTQQAFHSEEEKIKPSSTSPLESSSTQSNNQPPNSWLKNVTEDEEWFMVQNAFNPFQ